MKLITRNTDYAVRALCSIGRDKNKIFSVAGLAKELRIPRPFLRKILQQLNKKGLLKSQKGKDGGFSLVKPLDKVFLTDVMRIFQGALKLNECFLKKELCYRRKICPLKRKIDSLEKKVLLELSAITIMSLIKRGP